MGTKWYGTIGNGTIPSEIGTIPWCQRNANVYSEHPWINHLNLLLSQVLFRTPLVKSFDQCKYTPWNLFALRRFESLARDKMHTVKGNQNISTLVSSKNVFSNFYARHAHTRPGIKTLFPFEKIPFLFVYLHIIYCVSSRRVYRGHIRT